MDGGVSDSSTHAQMLEGARSVLIIAMFDFLANPPHADDADRFAEQLVARLPLPAASAG